MKYVLFVVCILPSEDIVVGLKCALEIGRERGHFLDIVIPFAIFGSRLLNIVIGPAYSPHH